ncbi:MAG TPA: FixH family protein [Polyangiaceae bacterium]|nr:FixH family protein [Polyangiaceae bacterium]
MKFRLGGSVRSGFAGKWHSGASALACASFALLIGCGSTGGGGEPDGSVQGELHIYRVDYLDGHSEGLFYLAAGEGAPETRLIFAQEPNLQPWTQLKVWGTETTDGISVARYQEQTEAVTDDVESTSQALTVVTKKTATVGFVPMDVGNGVTLMPADAETAVFGVRTPTQAGLNQYYNENSYGAFNFTGDILPTQTVTTLGTCQQSAITAIEKQWPTTFGKTYDHWMQYIGSSFAACMWGGLGGEGTASRPATGSWFNASSSCTVFNQEVGHNLGLMHSNSITCNLGSLATTPQPFADDPQTNCSAAEYGDRHTVMGSGCAHFGAYEKWYEGYFGGCNAVRATASGTYTLLPTELACDGVQALQIPMPKTRAFHNTTGTATPVNLSKYYLELRTKVGIDGKENGPDVLVTIGGDVPASNKTSEFTWVLDMDPTTPKTAEGLTVGKSFSDPGGGVTFTVQDIDATHATVNVTVDASTGPATCFDGTTFSGPGPQACSTTTPVGSGGTGAGGATGGGGSSGSGTTTGGMGQGGSGTGVAGSGVGVGGSSSAGASSGGASGFGGASAGAPGSAGSSFAGVSSGGSAGASGPISSAGSTSSAGSSSLAGSTASAGSSSSGTKASSSGSSDSSGCSCRQAPVAPSRGGLAGASLLVLGLAIRRRRQRVTSKPAARRHFLALGVPLAATLLGCSSGSDNTQNQQAATNQAPTQTADTDDCTTRAEGVSAGMSKLSSGGYSFTVSMLDPAAPVQSEGPPGNTWTVAIADASGAPVTGAILQVSSYMPDHGHFAPTAVAVEQGGGVYQIESLILPMPGLYAITFSASLSAGASESAAFSLCMTTSS